MSDLEISVVVPALNEEKYLPILLESLKRQTFPADRFEVVVVVDKRTTDKTEAIAREYDCKIVQGKNIGVANARREGFAAAVGKIIASTDADSKADPTWLQVIFDTFQSHPDYVGITGASTFYDGGKFNKFMAGKPYDFFQQINLWIGLPSFPGFNFAVRKEAYDKTSGFNGDLKSAEDVDLSLKLKKVGKLAFVPQMKVSTSARRIENQGRLKFFKHHLTNYWKFTILRQQPEGFENIR